MSRYSQKRYKVLHYGGRAWNSHERNYSVGEQEFASILHCLDAEKAYFLQGKFTILTDHISLKYIRSLNFSHGRLFRWALRIQNYNFEVNHLAGKQMLADFLSRTVYTLDNNANNLEDDSRLVFITE